jgi:hypothetical protein
VSHGFLSHDFDNKGGRFSGRRIQLSSTTHRRLVTTAAEEGEEVVVAVEKVEVL